jgi:sugar phosphate isomerase/epimerase
MAEYSLEEVIEAAARIGYDGIEFRGMAPHLAVDMPVERVKDMRTLMDDAGMRTSCIATYGGRYSTISDEDCLKQIEELKVFLEFAGLLGCDLVRHAPGRPRPKDATKEQFNRSVEWMRKAANIAESAGCRLAAELHFGGLTESAQDGDTYLKAVNRPNVGVIFDPGNMYISHAPYGEEEVKLLGERIFHVHVKDELKVDSLLDKSCFNAGDEIYQHKLLGEGAVDHVPAFRALKAIGYVGYLSCECHGAAGDKVAVAEREYNTMKHQVETM